MASVNHRINAQIDHWLQRLIDLSRRNRLLYFRESRRGTVRLLDPSPSELFDSLTRDDCTYRFWVPEPEQVQPDNEDADENGSDEVLDRIAIKGLGLVCSDVPPYNAIATAESKPEELARTLRRLAEKASFDLNERGVRILHVAFGMLNWEDPEMREAVRSPLLMVPVELARSSRNDPWELSPCDEEIVLNPVIVVKLQRDFGVTLPEPPDNWDNLTLEDYLQQFSESLKDKEWSVADEAWLGLFSYHKLPIYQDLNQNREYLCRHPIIARLCGVEIEPNREPELVVQPEELDNRLDPRHSFLVVDADSSQLAAIETVKLGTNLVLHGPPGTGKSQTITNVIAEMLAAGKTVLFVSEKMAALEVVYQRIQAAHLAHLCLELHSHKASRRAVVEELYRAMQEQVQGFKGISEAELERLSERRTLLNGYVSALYQVRQPIGRSLRDVLGELAELHEIEERPVETEWVIRMGPREYDWLLDTTSRLLTDWPIVIEGEAFPWYGLRAELYGQSSPRQLRELLERLAESAKEVETEVSAAAAAMGLPIPTSLAEADTLASLAELLSKRMPVEADWLRQGNGAELAERLADYKAKHSTAQNERRALEERQGRQFVDLADDKHLESLEAILAILSQRLGLAVDHNTQVATVLAATRWVIDLHQAVPRIVELSNQILTLLELSIHRHTLRRTLDYIKYSDICRREPRPLREWLTPGGLHRAQENVEEVRAAVEKWREKHAALANVDVDRLSRDEAKSMLARYQSEHSGRLAFLRSQYRADAKVLASCVGKKVSKAEARRLLEDIVAMYEARELAETKGPGAIGQYYNGLDTEFGEVERALSHAKAVLELANTTEIPYTLPKIICEETPHLEELISATDELRGILSRLVQEGKDAGIGPLQKVRCDGRDRIVDMDLNTLGQWLAGLEAKLYEPLELLQELYRNGQSTALQTLAEFRQDIETSLYVRELEARLLETEAELKIRCGSHYTGPNTDWDALIAATKWAAAVARLLEQIVGENSDAFIERITSDAEKTIFPGAHYTRLCKAAEEAKEALAELEQWFAEDFPRVRGKRLENLPFADLLKHLQSMAERLDDLEEWTDLCQIRQELERAGLARLAESLWSRPPPTEQLLKCVRASVLRTWVEATMDADSRLRGFRAEDHERIIAEFRRLDRAHWTRGAPRVIEKARPEANTSTYVPAGSERDILAREAMKKRRHLPIRRLFEKISNLLQQLKPCLLMSPLSVSQFLPPDMKFDLVVFDEASQICSEDAVGAIYRGKQVLICGDQRQLPPTDFFQRTLDDDLEEYVEAEEETIDVFESVLDECLANGLRESWLRWHYRSRHENLIAFSNDKFYDYRLVTFPAAREDDHWLGVHFVHVPNGVYDRGGKRTNEPEACKVVDLALEHLRSHPDKSLGIVSFSVAQTQAIEDELERRASRDPQIDDLLRQGRNNGFFVKNLENVQGDERDVIIFSIGYGRDRHGRLTMNFGPLNQAGGERRLNVAVTRARERVVLVSSIRAVDIDPSQVQAPGVRLLHAYLDYAERGPVALEAVAAIADREYESPLERDVAEVVRQMGYEVVPQVGCSGFRIDLGVRLPGQPGRFILGIECDGATYHSSRTARDRDRLRQEVLEDLGWRIHRVWAPAWVRRRKAEVERLRQALIEAEKLSRTTTVPNQNNGENEKQCTVETVHTNCTPAQEELTRPLWTVTYVPSQVQPRFVGMYEFHDPACREDHARCILEIVAREGPVHIEIVARRLAFAWGIQRIGPRVREAVETASWIAVRSGRVMFKGDFLWPTTGNCELCVRVPEPGLPESKRRLEHIPPEELIRAMQLLCRDGGGMKKEALVAETARLFGIQRVGPAVLQRLNSILEAALEQGLLGVSGDSLVEL